MKQVANLLSGMPDASRSEVTELLISGRSLRLERIVSRGQASPPGHWYDQEMSEWVAVISGRARLRFERPAKVIEMGPGDWVDIPAGTRHRVEWTAPDIETVWLAAFYEQA